MISPMTDAALARWEAAAEARDTPAEFLVTHDELRAFVARLRAAEARALPEPRLMRTAEDVEALADGYYLGRDRRALRLLRRKGRDLCPWPDGALVLLMPERCVGAWISGPIPDLPLPIPALPTAA